jgi:hypothetical protein
MTRRNFHITKVLQTIVFPVAISLLACTIQAQTIPADSLYLGQTPPGDQAVVFAPGVISIPGRNVPCITFSPDGKSAFFYIEYYPNPGNPYTMFTEYKNDKWSTPVSASFTAGRRTGEPFFAFSGSRIYLFATGAANQVGSVDLSFVEKNGSAWTNPRSLGNPPNTSQDQYHPCIVSDTSIYFSTGNGEIARCQYQNGSYKQRVILPYPVNYANTMQTWGDPYVAPDESYIIFKSIRAGGYGQNDIYISYKKADGAWTNPKNPGNRINSSADETAGDITPDGKYMTFGSNKSMLWVSASFIDSLKHTNFVPYLKNKLPNQTGKAGVSFNYTIPDSAFIDDDGNNTITCYVTSRLPSGLNYDPDTRTFSGIPTEAGSFIVNVKAIDETDASASASFTLKIDNASGINNQTFDQSIRVFPNPTKGAFTVSFGTAAYRTAIIKVYNMTGEEIFSKTICTISDESIDLNSNPKGLYLLSLIIDGAIINRKICLE